MPEPLAAAPPGTKAPSATPSKPREAFASGSRRPSPARPAGDIAGGEARKDPPGSPAGPANRKAGKPAPPCTRKRDTYVALLSAAVAAVFAGALAPTLRTATGGGVQRGLKDFAEVTVCFFIITFASKESASRRAVWVGAAILLTALGAASGATGSEYFEAARSVARGAFFLFLWRVCGWCDDAPAATAMKWVSLATFLAVQVSVLHLSHTPSDSKIASIFRHQ